jgi:subtilisin family serine protease
VDGARFTRLRSIPHTALPAAPALLLAGLLTLVLASGAEARIYGANPGADQRVVSAGQPRGAAIGGGPVYSSWLRGGICDIGGCPSSIARASAPEQGRKFVPGELLVRFRSGVGARARSTVLDALDATTKRRLPLPGLQLVRIAGGESVPEAIASFERRAQVRYAEPNFIFRIEATPDDPRFGELWGLDNSGQTVNGTSGTPDADIDAPEAWDTTTGSSAVTVAVVDTGVDYDHPDLSPNIRTNPGESGLGRESNGVDDDGNGYVDDWRGWDFIESDNDPRDLHHHGTHVAGTIGARGDNGSGVAGVNWRVGLLPVRVLDAGGFGTNATVTAGFAYAGANGAKVVNASLGGPAYSQSMADAIASSPNTLFVVSAGNDAINNDANPQYPCNYTATNLVCVAATTQSDGLAGFSDYGTGSVDLGAPGTNVLSAFPEDQFASLSGTSMAAPHVAGAAALLWAQEPVMSPDLVKSTLLSSVDPLPALEGKTVSGGRLNVYRALGGSPPFPPNPYAGPEIPVNTTTASVQDRAAIAPDPGGGFTVAWQSSGQDGDGLGVYARRFDAAGAPLGGEIPVNLTTPGNQGAPAIAPDPGGGFTVAWKSFGYDGSGRGSVYARRFDAAGAPLGGEIAVNLMAADAQHEPAIAPDPGGGFTVAWTSEWQDGDDSGVYARRFADTPDTSIDSGPPGPTDDLTPSFAFSSTEEGSSFECRLDGAGFQSCSSPHTTDPLTDGPHAFEVRAVAPDQTRDPTPARRAFTVDTAAPETQIDAGPSPLTNNATPSFDFSSSEPGSTFECRFDSDPFAACSGPGASHTSASDLADGPHSFEVRATDKASNTDPTPAARSFTTDTSATPPGAPQVTDTDPDSPANNNNPEVKGTLGSGSPTEVKIYRNQDCSGNPSATGTVAEFTGAGITINVPDDATTSLSAAASDSGIDSSCSQSLGYTEDSTNPNTTIDSAPSVLTNDPTPSFAFSSNEQGASFRCRLDGGAFSACSSPLTTAPLPDGPHSFEVRAIDQATNTDPTPASRTFIVDTGPPDTQIVTGPAPGSTIGDNTPTFTFSSSEQGSTFECQLDGGGFSACSSPRTTNLLPDGPHSFEVRSTDLAGQTDPSPASRSFTVDTGAPDTSIDSGPGAGSSTGDDTPTFTFSSHEQGVSFECRLDSSQEADFQPCTSPLTTDPLLDGPHSFEVRAVDLNDDPDPTPASRTFTVDSMAPLSGGPEIPVDTITPGSQFDPAIAPDPGGGFTVAWTSDEQGADVYARRFDAAGAPLGGVIPVNVTTASYQYVGSIAADGSGGFTVAWASYEQDGSGYGVYARQFPAVGDPSGEIAVNTTTAINQFDPKIAADGSGGFTVAWTSSGQDGSGDGVYARRFDSDGTPLSGEIPVNTTTTGDQLEPTIAADGSGGFTVAWTSDGQDGSGSGVYARRFDADGTPLSGEIPVNTTTTGDQLEPTIAADGSGGFTVAWTSDAQDGDGSGVDARPFDAAGAPLSGEFPVNTTTAFDQFNAAIAPDPGGGFTVAWQTGYEEEICDEFGCFLVPHFAVYIRRFTVPTVAPNTSIDSGPAGPTNDTTPTFIFSSSEEDSTFECRLDSSQEADFQPCTSPLTTNALPDGPHTFEVRAIGAAASPDPTPAIRSFSVDTTPPITQITSGPQGDTTDPNPTFAFSTAVPEPGVSFQCRLDSAQASDWQSCTSPKAYLNLTLGAHLFEVRATDALGNQDQTPDSRSFTIQPALPPPQPQEPQPSAPQPSAQPSFNLAKAIRRCRKKFDGKAERACIRKARAKARA